MSIKRNINCEDGFWKNFDQVDCSHHQVFVGQPNIRELSRLLLFFPFESRVHQLFGYEDDTGVRGGAVDPSVGVGEEDGGHAGVRQD